MFNIQNMDVTEACIPTDLPNLDGTPLSIKKGQCNIHLLAN